MTDDDRRSLAFLGTFESLRMAPTFARGRRDERAGHVRQLTISGSLVVALVRGPDDPKAFRARIAVRSFGASEWARVEQDLAASAHYAASMLAGRLPDGIAEVFAAAGLSLVPLSLDEVAMDCTCERWPMPCTHLAATCYALARSFEEDPFGVFTWRGRGRDELLLHLRELRSATAFEPSAGSAAAGSTAIDPAAAGFVAAGYAGGADSGSDARAPAAPCRAAPRPGTRGSDGTPAAPGEGFAPAGGGGELSAGAVDGGPAVVGAGGRHGTKSRFVDIGGGGGEADEAGGGDEGGDLGDFWGEDSMPAAPVGGRPGSASRPDALLDQLDPPPLAHDGRPIVDVLRPAYRALPEG